MSAYNPQFTYTQMEIDAQRAAIDALESTHLEIALRVQSYPNGDLRRIAALMDCREIWNEIEQAHLDLESMKRGVNHDTNCDDIRPSRFDAI